MNNTYHNGTFRKKKGFTMASNSVIRNQNISLKAKGLYTLIQSYITCESLEVTKAFLVKQCMEGDKAFDTAWNELKKSGYLKMHLYPAEKGQFRYEYELLDEADFAGGVYLYRYDREGRVTSTNMSSISNAQESKETQDKKSDDISENSGRSDDHTPHFGSSGKADDHHPRFGGSGRDDDHTPHFRCGGKGGGNIILNNNTKYNHLSINQEYEKAEIVFKKQINYDGWKDEENVDKELLNLIVKTAVELMTMPDEYSWRINQIQRSAPQIRKQIERLNHEHISYIMQCIQTSKVSIKNVPGFIRTSLYNAPDTYSIYKTKQDDSKSVLNSDEKRRSKEKKSASRFHNFNQRQYDYSAMEVELVRRLQMDKN